MQRSWGVVGGHFGALGLVYLCARHFSGDAVCLSRSAASARGLTYSYLLYFYCRALRADGRDATLPYPVSLTPPTLECVGDH